MAQDELLAEIMGCKHWGAEDAREFFQRSIPCGTWICDKCDHHAHVDKRTGKVTQNLARCYCGWSVSGRNGREELEEMGETIEPEEDDY